MIPLPRVHVGAAAAAGPLVFLRGSRKVALGEWVILRAPGQQPRRGQVVDAGEDMTVIQVLEETSGLAPARTELTLTGEVPALTVGRELLGRAFDGMGRPLDGLPAPVGDALAPLTGRAMNPSRRVSPHAFIETGLSAIDGLNTLVRGQKLPLFSGPGLPGLEIAAQIVEGARAPRGPGSPRKRRFARGEGEPFAVIFVGLGITARERHAFVRRLEASGAMERTILYLNEARDPTIERLLAPRVALTAAEHLAFAHGTHVLVVMADVTHYCEALREIGAAREEVPGRRGYPGYMYTDLAAIFERAGVLAGRQGSVTQIPVLTMPDDDITHPIPDLTGYIAEGQLVLSRELHRRGLFPPLDVLPSLSRLMNAGIGAGKTVPEHREWADQLYALYARGRDARLMAAIVGETGLHDADRRALGFAERFEKEFVAQGRKRRSLSETIETGWRLLESLPQDDLVRIRDATWRARRAGAGASRADGGRA